jgi:hypothetical protein
VDDTVAPWRHSLPSVGQGLQLWALSSLLRATRAGLTAGAKSFFKGAGSGGATIPKILGMTV